MNCIDRYGRIHDNPVVNGEPSSDNGWLYSAVYHKLGGTLSLDAAALQECYTALKRHPDGVVGRDLEIPISRDEILGLEYLLPGSTRVIESGWNFSPYPVPEFNLILLITQAIKLVDWSTLQLKHRNTFWRQGYDQIYRFAFSVPWSDRYTILKLNGKNSLFWRVVHKLLNRPTKDRSGRQLYWFKTGKDISGVFMYHPEGSPIREIILKHEK